MKRFLSLIAVVILTVTCAFAQDFKWKDVKSTMTTVPEDFYVGATKADAADLLENDFMAEGAVYAANADGTFEVLHWDEDWIDFVAESLTWSAIIESDVMYQYPASTSATKTTLSFTENDELINIYEAGEFYAKVTFARQMARFVPETSTKLWHTVAFPFAMSEDQIVANFGANATIMKLTAIDDNMIYFEPATSIEEETLYLVQLGDIDADVTQIELENVTMFSMYGKYETGISVYPTYEETYLDEDFFYAFRVFENNQLKLVSSPKTLTATKWYISQDLEGDAKNIYLSINGVATSIDELPIAQEMSARKTIEKGKLVISKDNKEYRVNGTEIK